jgi:hypothetical protein
LIRDPYWWMISMVRGVGFLLQKSVWCW